MLEVYVIIALFLILLFKIAATIEKVAGTLQEGNDLLRWHIKQQASAGWVLGPDNTWRLAEGQFTDD